jgi:hypothetical protein
MSRIATGSYSPPPPNALQALERLALLLDFFISSLLLGDRFGELHRQDMSYEIRQSGGVARRRSEGPRLMMDYNATNGVEACPS